ncbi:caspase domain-containing protein [Mycena crocata]|nr:caspase domain-containing protein [Mycena crocata]
MNDGEQTCITDGQEQTRMINDEDHSRGNDIAETPAKGTGQVFAIVIGINDYIATDAFNALQGAVNDARAFERYLLDPRTTRGLEVPASHIALIENRNATRTAILSTFRTHFLDNPDIPDHGEATMILFFAGHGSRVQAPEKLMAPGGKIEAICPVDERTVDADGQYVHAIPDYVLGWLLWELSEKKGPNITVIFDSCHSGGMGRNAGRTRSARSFSSEVPLELDSHLWEGRTEQSAQSYRLWSSSATSHVLMAACREDETAREIMYADQSIHGRFTESLITWLRRVVLKNTTYAELLNRLPVWSGQNPHCGGARRDRLLFNGNYPATGRRAVPLALHTPATANPDDPENSILQSFRIEMGSVEGVVPGTEFAVHGTNNTLLATLVAHSVEVDRTILTTKDRSVLKLPKGARATVSDWKNDAMVLHVYTAPDFPYTADLFPTTNITRQPKGRKFVQAPTAEDAEIALHTVATASGGGDANETGTELVFERLSGTLIECARETRWVPKGNTQHLPAVLDGIAHFNYFLERHHGSAPLAGFTLEMHRLEGVYPARVPDRSFGQDGNLVEHHEVRLKDPKEARYGFTLRNTSEEDLFAYLFYFDPMLYTIDMWYAPEGAHVLPPLRNRDGTVAIGMGNERAFEFGLEPGQTSSAGFLKLFVSTQFLDLRWIRQISPFDPKFQGTGRLRNDTELAGVPRWDALSVVLTMEA